MELHKLMLCNIEVERWFLHTFQAIQHYSIILIKNIENNVAVIPISVFSKLEAKSILLKYGNF